MALLNLVAKCDGHCRKLGISAPVFYARLHEYPAEIALATIGEQEFNLYAAEGAAIPPEEFNELIVAEIDELLSDMPDG